MHDLLVISGPAGAGKSTVASLVSARLPRSAVVRGDDFFDFLDQGAVVPWLPEAKAQNEMVTRAAAAAAGALTEGFAVVYDGLVAPGFIGSFLDATGLEELSYALMLPPADVCLARVRARTGHGFSDEYELRRQHATFSSSGMETRHRMNVASADPEVIAEDLFDRWQAGSLCLAHPVHGGRLRHT